MLTSSFVLHLWVSCICCLRTRGSWGLTLRNSFPDLNKHPTYLRRCRSQLRCRFDTDRLSRLVECPAEHAHAPIHGVSFELRQTYCCNVWLAHYCCHVSSSWPSCRLGAGHQPGLDTNHQSKYAMHFGTEDFQLD